MNTTMASRYQDESKHYLWAMPTSGYRPILQCRFTFEISIVGWPVPLL